LRKAIHDLDKRSSLLYYCQTFYCNFKIFIHWNDQSLINVPKKQIDWKNAFDPDIVIANEYNVNEVFREIALKDPTVGSVKLTRYFRGTLKQDADMHDFPFDFQDLPIVLRPHKLDSSKVILMSKSGMSVLEHHGRHEWDVIGHRTESSLSDPDESTTRKQYSVFTIIVMLQRCEAWYIPNLFVTNFLLAVMSLFAFVMRPEDTGDRMELCLGLVIASIATKYTVSDKLPKVPYMTVADKYMNHSLYIIVLVTVSNALVAVWPDSAPEKDAGLWGLSVKRTVDVICCCLLVAFLFATHVTMALYLRRHYRDLVVWKSASIDHSVRKERLDRWKFCISSVLEVNGQKVDTEPTRLEILKRFRLPTQEQLKESVE